MRKNIVRSIAALLSAAVIAGTFTACGNSANESTEQAAPISASASGNETQGKQNKENVGTLEVAWFPSSIKSALTTVAYDKGYFTEEGVTVNSDVLLSTADSLTALSEGKVDIVPVGITLQLQFMAEGQDLIFFGGSAQEGGAIITKPENTAQFAELSGWAGKKWASARSYTGDNIIRSKLL